MPDFMVPAMTERFDSEVSMMTGVMFDSSRILASMAGPSMFGMVTSRMTRSNWHSFSLARPWMPSSASMTSKPRSFTCFETMVRTARLSSTVRILGMVEASGSGDTLVDPQDEAEGVGLQHHRVSARLRHFGGGVACDDLGEAE